MTKTLSLIILTFLLGTTLSYSQNEPIPAFEPKVKPAPIQKFKDARTQRKLVRKAEEPFKKDQPNKYVEHYVATQIMDGETSSGYDMGYRLEEYASAKGRADRLGKKLSLNWRELGPGNAAGRTRALIIDPADATNNTWIAASVGGGIWKTTTAGQSWVNKTDGLDMLSFTCMVMAPSNENVIYAGTGEGFFNADAITGDGIWKSIDRGETWIQLSFTAKNSNFFYVNRLLVDPANANNVVAATNTGIFTSSDGGNTWILRFSSTNNPIQHIIANPLKFNVMYASRRGVGILKSTNGGQSWASVSSNIGTTHVGVRNFDRIELAISEDTSRVYASVSFSQTITSGLYVSTNSATSWIFVNEGSSSNAYSWLGGQGWYDNAIAVNPYNSTQVFLGGVDFFRMNVTVSGSTASGSATRLTRWYTGTALPYIHADQHSITIKKTNIATQDYRMVVTNDGGIFYTDDKGTSWTEATKGFNTIQFYGADRHPTEKKYLGGTQDNGTWLSPVNSTKTSDWSEVFGGDGFDVSWNNDRPNEFIVSLYNNGFYKSYDQGSSFVNASSGIGGNSPFITSLAKTNVDPDLLFAVGSDGVWRTENFANSWSLSPINSSDWGYNGTAGFVRVSSFNPQIVWAGFRVSNVSTPSYLHVSTDGGITFKKVNNPTLGFNFGRISGLAIHPIHDSTAYMLFSFKNAPKILKTTNLGTTWTDISGFESGLSTSSNGFPNVAVRDLLVMPYNPNILWAATEIGIFISENGGSTWTYSNFGLPAVAIWSMRIVENEVIVATHGRGLWAVELAELAGFTPPPVVLSPSLKNIGQSLGNELIVDVDARSNYDSLFVTIDGQITKYLNPQKGQSFRVKRTFLNSKQINVQAKAFAMGKQYLSSEVTYGFVLLKSPTNKFVDNFEFGHGDNYAMLDFSISQPTGFTSSGLGTPHPYLINKNGEAVLLQPVIVAPTNATISFDEIVLFEPGESGTVYGDDEFWDFVIVEATKDGLDWEYLTPGYDSRDYSPWLNAYNSGTVPTPALFKKRTLNLLNKFSAGDTILIRFAYYSDPAVVGWGWMIDNLEIQGTLQVGVDDQIVKPTTIIVDQNYPNPFNPTTTVRFFLPQAGKVTMLVFDGLGREIAVLENNTDYTDGTHDVIWNAENLPTGVYFLRFQSGSFTETKKMILVK